MGSTACLFFLPGCWDYQKINDRAPVIGIGVDPVRDDTRRMSYTFQIPIFEESSTGGGTPGSGSSGGGSSAEQYQDFTVTSHGLVEALRLAQLQYPKVFYLSNLQVVVMSDHLASSQIRSVTSELERTPTVDKLTLICFTAQAAKDILESKGEQIPADSLDRSLGTGLKQHAYTTRTRLWEFWRDWKAIGIDPQTPVVQSTDSKIRLHGMLVLSDTTPKVQLSPADTLYFNLVAGSVRGVAIWVEDGNRSFEVGELQSRGNISASIVHGKPELRAVIRVRGVIMQDETRDETILTTSEIARYRKVMEREMQAHAEKIVRQLQQQQTDAYGFGRYILIHDPSMQTLISTQWPKMFADAKVDIQVKVIQLHKGTLM